MLRQADIHLNNLIQNEPRFLEKSVELFISEKHPVQFRHYLGCTIKNLISYHWDTTPQVKNQREKIRIKLLNGVVLNANHSCLIHTNALI